MTTKDIFVLDTITCIPTEHVDIFNLIKKYTEDGNEFFYSQFNLKDSKEYIDLKNIKPIEKYIVLESLIKYLNALDVYMLNNKNEGFNVCFIENHVAEKLMMSIIKMRIDFPEDYNFVNLFNNLYKHCVNEDGNFVYNKRPFSGFINQLDKHIKRIGLNEFLKEQIKELISLPEISRVLKGEGFFYANDVPALKKSAKKLSGILLESGDEQLVPDYQFGTGPAGLIFSSTIQELDIKTRSKWNTLFYHLSSANGGKPNIKFIDETNKLIDGIGVKQFKQNANDWIEEISKLKVEVFERESTYRGEVHTYESHEYIEPHNHNVIKGLLWAMCRFYDANTLKTIATLTQNCFKKIPGIGPAAVAIGNASIYTLAQSKGLNGISHLSRLKLNIKQNNTQKLIQKYIDEQAQKQGIKPSQIEEIAASDFGLNNAIRSDEFDDFTFEISLTKVGEVKQTWIKSDGTIQKTLPKFVKDSVKLSEKLKKLKDIIKQIKQSSTTQRERIDRLYTENLEWSREDFEKYYINHGLICVIARNLIWKIDGRPFMYIDDQWVNQSGQTAKMTDSAKIKMWHPIDSEVEDVLAWRELLEKKKIKQPFKQAYREIYLLTDAEINTRVYSNRMAAHILKQHQFNSLAAIRGWKYSLLGAYDDGRDGEIASKKIPDTNLTAQFWINEIIDDTDSFNDAGIWYYVATDQIRFVDDSGEPVELIDVPALVLTEVMRDVDLFVGVASVANDPTWQDGGPDARAEYREYWQTYSFGDLTEIAKTRKSVLERLIPRLKIKDKVKIEGKFLIVTGTKHTYKIHIGSGNILIAPQDTYLCIVPGRGKDKNVDKLFLPFEGDNGLSIVLSKAFLLVSDDKITDATILSQL